MPLYANIGGVQKELSALYANVGGAQKQLSSMLANVSGASKEIYNSSGGTINKMLSTVSTMSKILLEENGVLREFYVLRHNAYTSGRTLVMRKNTYTSSKWNNTSLNSYAGSVLDTWFNSTYYNQLSSVVRNHIYNVSIPYTPGNGDNDVTSYLCNVFALSGTELGLTHEYINVEGTTIPNINNIVVAQDDGGNNLSYWTRSPRNNNTQQGHFVIPSGSLSFYSCTLSCATRPAFTLLSSMYVDVLSE